MFLPILRRAALAGRHGIAALFGLALSIAAAAPLAAQATGTIVGRVIDADNGQPVAAAQVTVAGTQLGRATGDDGRRGGSSSSAWRPCGF